MSKGVCVRANVVVVCVFKGEGMNAHAALCYSSSDLSGCANDLGGLARNKVRVEETNQDWRQQ